MNDEFLSRLREEPRHEFATTLRERLRVIEGAPHEPAARRRWPALAAAAGALTIVAALSVSPALRAATQGFLDLFRVKRFAVVPFDPERLARLRDGQLDLKALFGGQVEVLTDPGVPTPVADVQAASETAGFTARVPAAPRGFAAPEVRVGGAGALRVTVDVARLEALLAGLDMRADVPRELDGARVTINTSPAVFLRYRRGTEQIDFTQARSPEIELPSGVDLARLGAVALEVAGLSPEEARTFAASIDWRTTLLVPVPAQQATYRQVDVRGHQGLLVTAVRRAATAGDEPRRRARHSVLLWVEHEQVCALTGPGNGVDLVEMALSLR